MKSVEQLALAIEEIPPADETCGVATPLLRDLTSRPDFAEVMHPRRQALFLVRLAICAGDESSFEEALGHAERATAADPESWSAQAVRMQLGMVAGKPLSSVEAFDALSRLRPEAIRNIDGFRIGQLVDAAHRADPSGENALKVYEAMLRAAWKPAAPDFDDLMRVEHAQLLIERNRLDEARKRLETVSDVPALVVLRADRRFDPLRQDSSFEAQLELGAGAERNVARAQAAMDANPRLLQAAVQYADALVAANRHADALASARTTLQRVAENPGSFDDAEMGKSMMTAMAGSSLYALGRYDEARAVFGELIEALEGDWLQASMRMTFANFLVGEGRSGEALETLPFAGHVSPYGLAWSEAIRVCASVQAGDEATAAKSLAWLESHEFDHDRALAHALLCRGDLDQLAERMIRRLQDPTQRPLALRLLQAGPATAFDDLPFMKAIREREAALRAREDVREAVDAVGRIETIPVQASGLY